MRAQPPEGSLQTSWQVYPSRDKALQANCLLQFMNPCWQATHARRYTRLFACPEQWSAPPLAFHDFRTPFRDIARAMPRVRNSWKPSDPRMPARMDWSQDSYRAKPREAINFVMRLAMFVQRFCYALVTASD